MFPVLCTNHIIMSNCAQIEGMCKGKTFKNVYDCLILEQSNKYEIEDNKSYFKGEMGKN